jgi:hypothetical protein
MSDYYLHVDIVVPEAAAADYESKLKHFLSGPDGFRPFLRFSAKANYELKFALKSSTFPYSGYGRFRPADDVASPNAPNSFRDDRIKPGGNAIRYVHLWDVPDIGDLDLATFMQKVADDPEYMAINSLIVREIQTFVRRVRIQSQPEPPSAPNLVRLVRRFPSQNIGPYIFKSGMLTPLLTKAGWQFLGQYQNVTGVLNVITEFWATTTATDQKTMLATFEELPKNLVGFSKLVTESLQLSEGEVRESFQLAPYSPGAAELGADDDAGNAPPSLTEKTGTRLKAAGSDTDIAVDRGAA